VEDRDLDARFAEPGRRIRHDPARLDDRGVERLM
jgi:hypothetical protein